MSRKADIFGAGCFLHGPYVLENFCHVVTEACRMLIPHGPDLGNYRVILCCLHGRPPLVRWVCI